MQPKNCLFKKAGIQFYKKSYFPVFIFISLSLLGSAINFIKHTTYIVKKSLLRNIHVIKPQFLYFYQPQLHPNISFMKRYLLTCLALFSFLISQGQTVTFETIDGLKTKTICKGTEVQLDLSINPAVPPGGATTYNVQWQFFKASPPMNNFIRNCQFPDPTGACTFLIDAPSETTTYRVTVNGSPTGAIIEEIEIIVEDVPNPGLDTDIFLCGKTGIINLFNELDGGPDPGGTWSNGTGTYDTSNTSGGTFTYTIDNGGACPAQTTTITVKPCGNNDTDNDGILNTVDTDDDNDGIPDSIEDGFCTSGSLTPTFVLEEDFGFGTPTRSRYTEGLGLTYNPILPQDTSTNGEYNVATSTHYRTDVGFDATFLATDLIGDVDADGRTDGRYLAINMKSQFFLDQPVFVADNLPVTPGVEYNFSMSIASLNNNLGELPANLTIEVVDQSTGVALFSEDSGIIANGTDVWNTVQDTFIPAAGVNVVTIRVINRQGAVGNGNDIGIDNIFLFTNACDLDRDGIPNSEDLDSDNDGVYDIVETGNAASDSNNDGRFDGAINPSGGSTTVTASISNFDSDGVPDFLDIDSDGDGIIDNIEVQSSLGYISPSGIDGNFNGVDDSYDTNGTPISPVDTNADSNPDYLNLNSDLPAGGDCLTDTVEAFDTNQDGFSDTTPTGSDTDGDGLDNAFDLVVLDRLTGATNASNGSTLPTSFPNAYIPSSSELDWREEYKEIDETASDIDNCGSTSTATFNLFDSLTEANIPGGVWTGPSTLTGGDQGTFDPTTNISGEYTYTLPSPLSCPSRIGKVTVSTSTPDAGTDGSLTICSNDVGVNLFDSLGGTPDAGGSWTGPDTLTNSDQGTFDPASNVGGTYTYTITSGSCVETADVVVTITPEGSAGFGVSTSFCTNSLTEDLFDMLLGTPDTGGTWTDPAGNPFGTNDRGTFDPGSLGTAGSGDYTYSVTPAGCSIPVTATVSVLVTLTPDPGIDGTLATCTNNTSIDLFSVLGGTPDLGGSWSGPDTLANGDQGTFDPASNTDGTYIYTVSNGSCTESAIVDISVTPVGNPGSDGTAEYCTTDAAEDLFDKLSGNPDTGGTWTDATGNTFGTNDRGNLDPSILGVSGSGEYTYTVTPPGCSTPASSKVTVTITETPETGTNGNLSICANDSTTNLFDALVGTPDLGGTWTGPSSLTNGDQGTFDPSTNTGGTYTYSITNGSCTSITDVIVTLTTVGNPGTDGTVEYCTTDTAEDLFGRLGGTPDTGGTWTDPAGNPFGTDDRGNFDPVSLGTAGSGEYTYTVTPPGCTISATAKVTVTVNQSLEAGTDGSLSVCTNATATSLFTLLGGNPDVGGVWTGPSPLTNGDQGTFDPATNIDGTYTYTVGSGSCTSTANVVVNVITSGNPGTDGTVNFCSTDAPADLFDSLGGTPDIGGTWTDPSGIALGTNDRGTFDPSNTRLVSGDYTYSVTPPGCTLTETAIVTVNIAITPTLALSTTTCGVGRNTYNVEFTTNGGWDISTIPGGIGTIDVTNSMILDIPADTDFTISASNPTNSSCVVLLDVTAPDCNCPDIAEPTNPVGATVCLNDPSPVLSVTVSANQTANWYDVNSNLLANNTSTFTPTDNAVGTYTYFVEAFDTIENCVSDRIEVVFTISEIEQSELFVEGVVCIDNVTGTPIASNVDPAFVFVELTSTNYTFEWSFEGAVIPGEINSQLNVDTPGNYSLTYTDNASGCSNTLTTTVESKPVISDSNLTLSLSAGAFAASNNIIATIDRPGNYNYSLDGGPFQESNIFTNVPFGLREVVVEDNDGCGFATASIFVIGFPRFFTPNNDGNNDTWNVVGDENLPSMTIYIFDRYGKLIDQLIPGGPGWDGTYNGKNLPSTDYWFMAQLSDGTETYKSHFTLKR